MKLNLIINLLSIVLGTSAPIISNTINEIEFDKNSINEDFKSSEVSVNDFINASFIEVIDFVEYCYGTNDYGLYLYVVIPNYNEFDFESKVNKVQLAVNNSSNYIKYDLKLITLEKNVFKFKIDFNSNEESIILNNLDPMNRIYSLSGFELKKKADYNATEFEIGGTWNYSGYAKGINNQKESTLKSTYKKEETIQLDINDLTYRYDDDLIKSTKRQLNSVYFSIPNYYLEEYGFLSEIDFEFYEYKTKPIYVIKDYLYDELIINLGKEVNDSNKTQHFLAFYYTMLNGTVTYNTFYGKDPAAYQKELWENYVPYSPSNTAYWMFKGGESGLDKISKETLREYAYNYDSSFISGKLHNDISADLFMDVVDKGRTRGYNRSTIKASENTSLTILGSNNVWVNLWNSMFGNLTNKLDIKLLEQVDSNNLSKESLLIEDEEYDDFIEFYNNKKNENQTYILRFANTEYKSIECYDVEYSLPFSPTGVDGYIAQETMFFDFDIIQLTFNKDGVSTILPVVANPIDVIGELIPPDTLIDLTWLLKILGVVLGVLFVVLILWLLSLIGITPITIIRFITYPFRKLSQAIKDKKRSKKDAKKKK